eukprot:4858479-Prymnesium_polylepis.1
MASFARRATTAAPSARSPSSLSAAVAAGGPQRVRMAPRCSSVEATGRLGCTTDHASRLANT